MSSLDLIKIILPKFKNISLSRSILSHHYSFSSLLFFFFLHSQSQRREKYHLHLQPISTCLFAKKVNGKDKESNGFVLFKKKTLSLAENSKKLDSSRYKWIYICVCVVLLTYVCVFTLH